MWDEVVVCLIDGKPFFGEDFDNSLPRNQLKTLVLIYNGRRVSLDVSQMYNPAYENRVYKDQFKLRCNDGICDVTAIFSDGAGGYVAQWRIINGKSIRTALLDQEMGFGLLAE